MLIIPAVDIQAGKCVRLTQGRPGTTTVYSDHPLEMGRHWAELGAERLHVVDLDGAFSGEPKNCALIRELVMSVGVPVQVGGGIRSIDIIKYYINCGAYRVIIGSKVVQDTHFIENAVAAFPGKVMVSIDASKGRVAAEGWTRVTEQSAIDLAIQMAKIGVKEIIYTDIERDGMLFGPNIAAIRALAGAVNIPVIASGGVSRLQDIKDLLALESEGVAGVIIGKALYTGAVNLKEALALAHSERP
jgi:phosphoribosylformimino-5-aminoimidazole carboxamide ribotide isomerase